MSSSREVGGRQVFPVGMGGAPIAFSASRPDEGGARAVVHAALDAGVRLFDTADVYSPHLGAGYSERVIAEAIAERPSIEHEVLVATKGGKYWARDGSVQVDGRPSYLHQACRASLKALGAERIWLYQLHAPCPDVPLEESVGALVELREAGLVEHIGLSNVDVAQIRAASAVTAIASVQNRLGPDHRVGAPELACCEELGIAFLPYQPLGGVVGPSAGSAPAAPFWEVAARHGVSPARAALAWELSLSSVVLPIPGATRATSIADSAGAACLELSEDDLALLGGLADGPVAAPGAPAPPHPAKERS